MMSYKKPPVQHQFQPGQSGNAKGRPRTFNESRALIIKRLLEELVEISEFGESYIAPAKLALVKGIANKARKGDPAAIKMLAGYYEGAPDEGVTYIIETGDNFHVVYSFEHALEFVDRANKERAKEGLPELDIEDLIEER